MKSALMMAMAVAGASARQMHAGINYERYLQEADSISSELDEWMSKFQDDAEIHGWLPQTEARSADEVYEDRKQRYFMSKELVEQLSKENPDAEFDVATSPFSLMTTDEFATYVKNAYLAGDHGRQLRARPSVDVDGAPASSGQEGNGRAHTFDFRKWWGNMWGNKNNNNGGNSNSQDSDVSASDSDSVIISSDGFTFQDLINWFNNQNKNNNNNGGNNGGNNRQPNNGPRPAGTPRTRAPVVAPTDAPATYSPGTRSPTTRAPVVAPTDAPTSGPNPRTPSPVNPVGPVAPADSPSGPTPTPIPTNAGETGADGNGMNWAKNKCMPPVQNQGQCGSCWAFATVAATETGKCIATKATTFTKLSEQNVATCDTRNMGCNGGATSYAMSYIQQSGVCTASDVPYTMGSGRQASCNSGCSKVASGIKSTSRVSGESGLVSALNKAPVVIAVAAGNAAWKQYRSGVLSTCQTTQVDHAVLAVGYDDSSIIIRNSWGPSWGEAGYIRMKRGGGSTGTCSMYRDMLQPQF